MKKIIIGGVVMVVLVVLGAGYMRSPAPSTSSFTLPSGFEMTVFAEGVTNARVMVLDPQGTLLVSEPSTGKIVALRDSNNDNHADEVHTVLSGLNKPHGMAFRCRDTNDCTLYVAETDKVVAYVYESDKLLATQGKKLFDLPSGGRHFTRTLLFMPSPNESQLLVSVGSSCDSCNESDWRRAAVLSYDTDTGKLETFASGLRNSVFMEIHPVNGAIWATEMGRDGLGDNLPPDEINIVEKGKKYGWPFCYGKNSCEGSIPAHIELQAHSAPLGIAFIPEEGWPENYWYNALIAYHGSWNRSEPTGYTIVRIPLDAEGKSTGPIENFITGWMREDGKTIGRPVDIKVFPGGKMFISDDQAGIIYTIKRTK